MKKIQMVDLFSQYQKIKNEVDAGIQEVLNTTTFIKGGKVNEFQANLEKYLGVKHVIPVGNG
ncbi:MAG TPA: DegT/DnrJ/EryC1/StrS family aminotransferase, partial [Paludibacteraceae bacterium]|nr:DegT/DnrJ/EryC1/StrS family aminotransferase [Paludibacteraceae bacterium]